MTDPNSNQNWLMRKSIDDHTRYVPCAPKRSLDKSDSKGRMSFGAPNMPMRYDPKLEHSASHTVNE